ALLVENTPVTLTEHGLFSWVSTNIRDERNAKLLSDPIDLILRKEKAEEAVLFNCKKNSELFICVENHAFIYNYSLNLFYYYLLPKIRGFTEGEEGIYFYTDEQIFSMGGDTDNGERIFAIWKSRELNFSAKEKLKKLFGVTIFATAEKQGLLKVSLSGLPFSETKQRQILLSGPQKGGIRKMRIPIKRFNSLQMEFSWEEESALHLAGVLLQGRNTDSEK
ncbi:MAG: hypothetical protein IKU24_05525, partial [Clostridia bacterium]|nr:hypothetical protein [Clostridia bacterium]